MVNYSFVSLFVGILIISVVVFISGCSDAGAKNLTLSEYKDKVLPKVIDYNKSKGTDNPNIQVKGVSVLTTAFSDPKFRQFVSNEPGNNYIFLNKTNATIFVVVDKQSNVVDTQPYVSESSGQVVDVVGYQAITDIVVIYYPSLEIAGWHRIIGPKPTFQEKTTMGSSMGGETGVNEWIYSLPGFTHKNETPGFYDDRHYGGYTNGCIDGTSISDFMG